MRAALALLVCLGCGVSSEQSYDVTGRVEGVDAEREQVRIAHDEIPGFMPAMTMSFDVASPAALEAAQPGDRVRFTLLRSATRLSITDLEVIEVGAGISGASPFPQDLEVAPGFRLVDQDGAEFALEDAAGAAVLLDFVFTRCPGPCPILTASHAELQRSLPPGIRERTRFVSISLDPEYDTPARLREYATARGADLAGWSFLTGDPDRVASVVQSYHVGSTRAPDGSIDHTVITFLIDPQGRIARRYFGLEHPAAEIAADVEALLP